MNKFDPEFKMSPSALEDFRKLYDDYKPLTAQEMEDRFLKGMSAMSSFDEDFLKVFSDNIEKQL